MPDSNWRSGSRPWALLLRAALGSGAFMACVSIDDIQTPNGDLNVSPAKPGASPDESMSDASTGDACEQGWTTLRLDGREQRSAWAAPSLVASCSSAPHRLTALAPGVGASFSLSLASNTGRVLEAVYSSTRLGADGEDWGPYDALIDVSGLQFGSTTSPTRQPFAFIGTIYGPFGPITIEATGCAGVRAAPC
jgi:hypothetical protein